MTLAISPTLKLELDAATDSWGILAKKGAGKSNAAVVMAEEMDDAGIAWVAVDPKGDWWGIRSSADGKRPGLAVPVFGGKHGDFPLEPGAGGLMADIILGDEQRGYLSCVVDVSHFTITDQRRFLHAFGTRLFQQKDEEGVLHLFLEEAHEYLPQSVPRDATGLVSTWQRIVKQGRFKGLGVTLVSQRSAALNKDVLTQVDSLLVLRTLSPQDRAAIKAWLDVHFGASEVIKTLHLLKPGEAWLWSPERFEDPLRFRFRQRRTFDSGATPKVGKVRQAPAKLADIDGDSIREMMAESIERAEAQDPKVLQRRIRQLEKELAEQPAADPIVREVEVPVEVPFVPPEIAERLGAIMREIERVMTLCFTVPATDSSLNRRNDITVPAKKPDTPKVAPRPRPAPPPPVDGQPAPSDSEREILTVLAQLGSCNGQDLAVFVGKRYSGGFRNYLSALRTKGWIVGANKDRMEITDVGLAALGSYEVLPTGRDLLAHWLGGRKLTDAEKDVLRTVDAHPGATGPELAEHLGKEYSGGFRNYLSKLRGLRLIEGTNAAGMRLSELLDD